MTTTIDRRAHDRCSIKLHAKRKLLWPTKLHIKLRVYARDSETLRPEYSLNFDLERHSLPMLFRQIAKLTRL